MRFVPKTDSGKCQVTVYFIIFNSVSGQPLSNFVCSISSIFIYNNSSQLIILYVIYTDRIRLCDEIERTSVKIGWPLTKANKIMTKSTMTFARIPTFSGLLELTKTDMNEI